MKLILIGAIIWFVSQSIKFLIFIAKGEKITPDSAFWIYFWIGKFPSSHTALLSGVIYTIWREQGTSLLFGFAVVCSAIFVFTLAENRKRYEMLKGYCNQSSDSSIRSIVSEGKLDEFEGHTISEIIAGFILGIAIAAIIGIYV